MCGWEDDHVQLAHPASGVGANHESLVGAQAVAIARHPLDVQTIIVPRVGRVDRDPEWRPLTPDEAAPRDDSPQTGRAYFDALAADSPPYYWRKR